MLDGIQIISYNINIKDYNEVRCNYCNALLMKLKTRTVGIIEVKCGRCNKINTIKLT